MRRHVTYSGYYLFLDKLKNSDQTHCKIFKYNFFPDTTSTIITDNTTAIQTSTHTITKRETRLDDSHGNHIIARRHLSWVYKSLDNSKRKKRTGSNEYIIEILVVADKNMAQYHKTKEDLIHYILTLMSHVSTVGMTNQVPCVITEK